MLRLLMTELCSRHSFGHLRNSREDWGLLGFRMWINASHLTCNLRILDLGHKVVYVCKTRNQEFGCIVNGFTFFRI